MDLQGVREAIERTFSGELEIPDDEFRELMNTFVGLLNTGQIRAAEPSGNDWVVNTWVKKGILLGFRRGKLKDYSINAEFRYFDKDTFPLRPLSIDSGVRLVPGGSTVRTGSYVSPGVVVMPPSYINVGAHIGPGSMVDSNVLVGSCAQIGSRVHLSAGVQIGGVLEPVGASPVIIEDDVLVGGNCGIYEGVRVRKGAVIGAGTILTAAIPVFDNVRGVILRGGPGTPNEIPAGAVVVPGSRPLRQVHPAFGGELQMACALIVKYRDSKTEASTALEDALR